MFGIGKFAAAGSVASLAIVAISTGVLASEQPTKGPDQGKSTHTAGSTCQVSGNSLIQNISFSNGHGSFTSLSGHVASGDQVTATFTVPASCSVVASLVSYKAPSASFDANTADQQTVAQSAGGTSFAAGTHSLTVTVPACYFQVDFVREGVITKLGPANSNNFYSKQGRLISGANGGTVSCSTSPGPPACASSSPQLTGVSYLLGGSSTVTDLRGHVTSGETVKATFTVPANCSMELSLASYKAPLPYFTAASAPQQQLYRSQDQTFSGGVHSLQVEVPGCMFQVDFVHGSVITTFGSTPAGLYGSRLISADNGGSTSCTSSTPTPTPSPTGTPTPTPSPTGTPTPTPTGTPTPTPTGTPAPTSTPTPVVHTGTPTPTGGNGGVLALSTSTPDTGAHIALGSAVLLVIAGLGLLGLSRIRRVDI